MAISDINLHGGIFGGGKYGKNSIIPRELVYGGGGGLTLGARNVGLGSYLQMSAQGITSDGTNIFTSLGSAIYKLNINNLTQVANKAMVDTPNAVKAVGGYVYYGSSGGKIVKVNPSDLSVAATLDLGNAASVTHLTYDAVNNMLYATSSGGVFKINLATFTKVWTAAISNCYMSIIHKPTGRLFTYYNKTFYEINVSTGAVSTYFTTTTSSSTWTFDINQKTAAPTIFYIHYYGTIYQLSNTGAVTWSVAEWTNVNGRICAGPDGLPWMVWNDQYTYYITKYDGSGTRLITFSHPESIDPGSIVFDDTRGMMLYTLTGYIGFVNGYLKIM